MSATRSARTLPFSWADRVAVVTLDSCLLSYACGTPSCRCHADPPQMHGPYWQWTAKIDGRTVTRRHSQSEAELYQEWIANEPQLRAIITQMRQVAAKATELTMKEVKNKSAKV
jgi:hypothetical protein